MAGQPHSAAHARAAHWIKSPAWDGFWIFAGVWAPALSVLLYFALRRLTHAPPSDGLPAYDAQKLAAIYLPLSVLHRISTTFSVLGTPILRDEVRRNPRRYLGVPLAIVLGCLALCLCFVFHSAFAFMPAVPGELWAFFALAYVMIVWERWHFCAQEFGVLSIYRIRAQQFAPEDKRFDRWYTVVLMMGVNMVLFFCAGFSDIHDVLLHGTPLSTYHGPLLSSVALCAFLFGMGIVVAALVREWRKPRRSLPKALFYLLIGGHSLLLYFFPKALGLFFLSYVLHHWVVAIGLFGRVGVNAYAPRAPLSGLIKLAARVGPVLVLVALWQIVFGDLDKGLSLAPIPDARWFSGASFGAKLLAGFAMSVFFSLDFLHYYSDRCFYSFSNPAIRKRVAPLLFGQLADAPATLDAGAATDSTSTPAAA